MNLLTVYYGKNREALALLQKNTQKGFGYFYIVEFSKDLVKIGCTRHPASRMEQLSCTIAKEVGLPIKRIAVSGKCKYFQKYEKIMHNAFKKERIEGSELFRVSFDTAVKVGTFLIKTVNEETEENSQAIKATWKAKINSLLKAGKFVELVGVAFVTGMEVARQLEKSEV